MADKPTKSKAKVVDKWKMKSWYTLVAPEIFDSKEMGQVVSSDEVNLINRKVKIGLGDMLDSFSQSTAYTSMYFRIKEVRGKGLMIGVEFQEPRGFQTKMAWKTIHAADKSMFPQIIVSNLLKKHRVLAQVAAHNHDIIKILPSLMSTEEDARYFVSALDDVLGECNRAIGPMLEFGLGLAKAAMSAKNAPA